MHHTVFLRLDTRINLSLIYISVKIVCCTMIMTVVVYVVDVAL